MAEKSNPLTPSQENYLEHILELSRDGPVRVRDIARAAGVRLSSVTKGISRLSHSGLVRHESYGHVEITDAGQDAALLVVRRDMCLSRLLEEILGMQPDEAEQEVCRIEHVVSSQVLRRLEILIQHASEGSSGAWMEDLRKKMKGLKRAPEERSGMLVGRVAPHVARHQQAIESRKDAPRWVKT